MGLLREGFKPQLLYRENPPTDKLAYPMWVSPKLDGIRGAMIGNRLVSRTLKDIPNIHARRTLFDTLLHGLDGELIVGAPTAEDVYRETNSFVMSDTKPGTFTYYVFDYWDSNDIFKDRFEGKLTDIVFEARLRGFPIQILEHEVVENEVALLAYEERQLDKGYEGIIIRNPKGLYKFNRTTLREMNAFKLKRFTDSEGEIIGFEEAMENCNEPEVNELGRTKRSTAMGGLVPKGTLGAFVVRDLSTGVVFNVGSGKGLTADMRQEIWDHRQSYLGKIIKYKFFAIGVKDKPRHPIWLGFRDAIDM
jgi:DNA ligase-1